MAKITDDDLIGRLIMPNPIIYFDDIPIEPLTLDEILNSKDIGYDKYNELLSILQINKTVLRNIPEEDKANISTLDILLYDDRLLSNLMEFLIVFLKNDNLKFSKVMGRISILTKDEYGEDVVAYLTKDNYDDFVEVMKKIYCVKFEAKEELKPANAKALEMLERMKKNAEEMPKVKKQAKFSLLSLISAIANRHPSLNYTNIYKLNVYQLWDAYYYLSQSNHFDNIMMGMYTGNVSGKDVDFEEISWIKKIKTF